MAVRLRLKRLGRKNRAFYRMAAFDSRTRRDGRPIEELGHYDPLQANPEDKFSLNRERIVYWLSVGALPSRTVESICLQQGIDVPSSGKRRALSPEEKVERERVREEKKKKRAVALQRKAAAAAHQTPMSKKERREAKKAGGR
ncbi:30S ribosomal protein S16 [Planctomycetota bacterium]|nr:30S ribosomal protein S16 [Planctomycetota bacterium]